MLDAVNNPLVEEVVVMSSAQVGKTEISLNLIGYHVDYDPCPIMLVQPSELMAESYSKDRLAPMIRDTPAITKKVKDAKARDSNNTILHKKFPGGQITMAGANSPASLASRPIRIAICDEVDRYPLSAGTEGDPVDLVKKRTTTFYNRKAVLLSTPTLKGKSRIEQAFEASDQRHYYIPCTECGHFQHLRWEQVKWKDEDPDTAEYFCEECGQPIDESQKARWLLKGKWIAHAEFRGIAGFHLNELYSPWKSLRQVVADYLKRRENPERLKTWWNTSLGLPWEEEKGEAPDWQRLYDRRESYKIGTVPEGGLFLTAGADVQKDRIEVEVVAWGRDRQSWSVEHKKIYGDTSSDEPWRELDQFLGKQWPNHQGIPLPIRILAIDSGYNTQRVYNWARRWPMNRVIAVKGRDEYQSILGSPSPVDVKINGRRIKRGFKVWTVGVSIAKSELYGLLNMETPVDGAPYPSGFCHFPEYDSEYFKQITAERLITKVTKKGTVYAWVKDHERNEALDIRVYARAAAHLVGLDRFTDAEWDSFRTDAPAPTVRGSANLAPKKSRKKQRKSNKSSFWDR